MEGPKWEEVDSAGSFSFSVSMRLMESMGGGGGGGEE